MKKTIGIGILALLGITLFFWSGDEKSEQVYEPAEVPEKLEPKKFYGFDLEEYTVVTDTIRPNQFLADILLPYQVSYPQIDALVKNAEEVFNVKHIKADRPYHLIVSEDSLKSARCMIYEADPINYVILHLEDSLYASTGQKEFEIREASVSGIIESSLYLSLTENNVSQALAMEMADIYAWTIDFYKIQKGDRFKVIYENKYIDDEYIGIGEVKACLFEHGGEEFSAYVFEQNGKREFFDKDGDGLRKAFLKSPLKFGRMTSGYTTRRFHPVQKRFKAHMGTDYAAPTGTPILATGDGTVIAASYTKGNGKYVKIRHNSTYSTQYLHMSQRKVTKGQVVKQGDVIGLVGATGLATGPHVCYRFWKNGSQIDHRKEKFPSTDPISAENKSSFDLVVKGFDQKFEEVAYPTGPLAVN